MESDAHPRHLVLVVGDVWEAGAAALTTTLLHAGFEAIAAETGDALLQLLDAGIEPCVVVSNVDLPDMDGFELLRRMKRRARGTASAAVLASPTAIRSIPAGIVPIRAILQKPVDLARLIEVVERHCPRRDDAAVVA